MKSTIRYLALALCFFSSLAYGASEKALDAGMVNPGYEAQPAWFKVSFLDLREDMKEATGSHKRVMLYFYQDGCPYCKKLLQDNFGQRPIAEKTQKYFDVIALNIWGDREVINLQGKTLKEKDFAIQMKVMFTPTLIMLDEKGEVAMRINGYYAPDRFTAALDYAGQKKEKTSTFQDYFAKHAGTPAQGKLHVDPAWLKPPYRLNEAQRTTRKPLLVLFEQKQCLACDELHLDILKRKESQALLDKFQVVQLDMRLPTEVITPDGRKTTASEWAAKLNVSYAPTMVYFDVSGKEVFRSEAYLKAFHVQSILDYVASGSYRQYPEFQRFIEARADALRAKGVEVDIMK
ncbi:MAG: thioredoxin fold domain-containing protein [Sulfuricellaceae bacterium]|nr:thioredoxin fold domain-containing protein [Sulfuricellaceae bacterium]